MNRSRIVILSGDIGSGKTSLCLEAAGLAEESGYKIAGLISPGIFKDRVKTGIELLDLGSGDRRKLAELRTAGISGVNTQRWSFDPEAISWGNQVLEQIGPCDLLILDELGPLEFNQAQGFQSAFPLIEKGMFQTALLVIRPSLVQGASRRWKIDRVLDLSRPGSSPLSREDLFAGLELTS